MSKPLTVQFPAIWLIPYAQLRADARSVWLSKDDIHFAGVMPQIMTIREWAFNLGTVEKTSTDVHFDAALDRAMAESLLRRAKLEALPAYVDCLLEAAYPLARVAAAIPPAQRVAWWHKQIHLFQAGQFSVEDAINRIALIWVANSSYDTDILWQHQTALLDSVAHIYVTKGLQSDQLVKALLAQVEGKVTEITLPLGMVTHPLTECKARDAEDLVQQTVACILSQPEPNIALIDQDRQITRRISAVLQNRGIRLMDETGWALSTTTAAAQLLAWMAALARDATSDQVLTALKTAPCAFNALDVQKLEAIIRRESWVQWQQVRSGPIKASFKEHQSNFSHARTLSGWLRATRNLLIAVGLWDVWQLDDAGQAVVVALHLKDQSLVSAIQNEGPSSLRLTSFVEWIRAVLEASRFHPRNEATDEPNNAKRVTILPLSQLWGRHFGAIIVPSCDENRLPARPRLQGNWTTAQRQALLLETQDDAAAAYGKAWAWLCAQKTVILLWQQVDGNESLQKSPLLQVLEMQGRLVAGKDPRLEVLSASSPANNIFEQGIAIDWQMLAPKQLSASSYADLCACPYRFYVSRILGLRSSEELDDTVDKRDFGTWLHGVLFRFHESWKRAELDGEAVDRTALLDACANAQQNEMDLDEAAFLPFSLIWPQTRDAYLSWLDDHAANGASYVVGEVTKKISIQVEGQSVDLVGKIDRIDSDGHGGYWLLDYKTENPAKTKSRIAQPDEDTQLAFYAALVPDESIQAAYVNLVERAVGKQSTQTQVLPDMVSRRETLLDGMRSDLSQIASGVSLRALGEGDACLYCSARGLCRKDFQ